MMTLPPLFDVATLQQELAAAETQVRLHPRHPKAYIQLGMVQFKLAQIPESIASFDQAERLDPDVTPYLWQRGLSYYYAERYADGARQFEVDLQVNGHDVEETVWRCLCLARDRSFADAQRDLLPVRRDPRRVMRAVYELFAGQLNPQDVLAMGQQDGDRGQFYSHLYVGLYYEAMQQPDLAKEWIVKGAIAYPQRDYMWHLACVHGWLRGWLNEPST